MTLNQTVAVAQGSTFQNQSKAAAVFYALNTAIKAASTTHGEADQLGWALAVSTIADSCVANLQRFVWVIANSGAGAFALNDSGDTNDALIESAMVTSWPEIALVNAGMESGQ